MTNLSTLFKRILSFFIIIILVFAISIMNSAVYGANSNNVAKITNVKITKKSDRIVFKWKKVKKDTGYIIKITKDKKFKKELLKITLKNNKNKYTYKNLKTFTKDKKYYVKVRAYKKINGTKKYGKWSNMKNFILKEKTSATGYWCDEGGSHHSFSDNAIDWYNTAIEAERKARELKQYTHYQVEQCDFCGKWSAILW